MKFHDLELDPNVLKAVVEAGYTTPTPIQAQAIPEALKGRDVLGIAQTGTGKTAGFTLPMITMLAKGRARARMPRSLIICPTRELAAQVAQNFETYGKYHKLTMALLIGGVSFKDQDRLIDRGVDVLIATPGRLLDHFERGKLMLSGVQIMVVDEADRMLDMGFIPDIERIFNLTPFTRQTLFFSATMPPEITRLTQTFLHNPVRVEVARQASVVETVDQHVATFRPTRRDKVDAEKRAVLRGLIDAEKATLTNAIVFCNRKRDVGVVHRSLVRHGHNAGALHGDLDQSVRTATLNKFRDNELTLLVASDVAARGLDIPTVSHVINYDVPIHAEDYVHRIGRTGRAGRSGKALTIASPADDKYLKRIEELIGTEIPRTGTASAGSEPEGDADDRRDARNDERSARNDERSAEKGERRSRRGSRNRRAEPETRAAESREPETREPERRPEPEPRLPESRPEPESRAQAPEPERAAPQQDRRGQDKRGERREQKGKGDHGRQAKHGGKQVVGMGDHVPAFLLRPTRPAKAKDDEDDENSEAA